MTYTFSAEWFALQLRKWIADRPLRSVAEDVGVSFSTLSRVSHGHEPSLDTFLTLCIHMKADPLDFCFNEDQEWEE